MCSKRISIRCSFDSVEIAGAIALVLEVGIAHELLFGEPRAVIKLDVHVEPQGCGRIMKNATRRLPLCW